MPLPILQTSSRPSDADLVRLFHRTELHWARHLGEEAQLDVGTAIANADLPNVYNANRVLDASLPEGTAPGDAVREAEAHFGELGVRCHQWVMNPAVPASRTAPLAEHLLAAGWRAEPADILYLGTAPAAPIREVPGLTIIPARASYRHARLLAEERAEPWGEPQLADAAMLHLDDPHWDALLALKDGRPVGGAGVLAVGDLGRVDQVFVSEPFRRSGVGRTLMSRALEICARSLFKHVMLSVTNGIEKPHKRVIRV